MATTSSEAPTTSRWEKGDQETICLSPCNNTAEGTPRRTWHRCPYLVHRADHPFTISYLSCTLCCCTSSSAPLPANKLAQMYVGKKAIVVGAGPAGSTAAMYLARAGWTVDVHERRPEPAADKVDNGRAYIIILVPRGKAALEELGVKLPSDPHFLTQVR